MLQSPAAILLPEKNVGLFGREGWELHTVSFICLFFHKLLLNAYFIEWSPCGIRENSRSEAVLEAMVYFLAVVVNILLIRLYLYAIF